MSKMLKGKFKVLWVTCAELQYQGRPSESPKGYCGE